MIEDWIDAMCDVWRTIDAPGFNKVNSPYLVRKTEFPATINPADDFPIALNIPAVVDLEYSVGLINEGFYTGVTEFHITPDLSMAHMPSLLPWYGKIWIAAAANMRLSGLVHTFELVKTRSIIGPVALKYGNEAQHWGFLVNWFVKESSNPTVIPGDSSLPNF